MSEEKKSDPSLPPSPPAQPTNPPPSPPAYTQASPPPPEDEQPICVSREGGHLVADSKTVSVAAVSNDIQGVKPNGKKATETAETNGSASAVFSSSSSNEPAGNANNAVPASAPQLTTGLPASMAAHSERNTKRTRPLTSEGDANIVSSHISDTTSPAPQQITKRMKIGHHGNSEEKAEKQHENNNGKIGEATQCEGVTHNSREEEGEELMLADEQKNISSEGPSKKAKDVQAGGEEVDRDSPVVSQNFRLTRDLRLPSQHTPKPPPIVGLPAPADGRRLIFDSITASTQARFTSASDSAKSLAGEGTSHVGIRPQQFHQQRFLMQQQPPQTKQVVEMQHLRSTQQQYRPLQNEVQYPFPENLTETRPNFRNEVFSYTKRWFLLFLPVYVVLSVAATISNRVVLPKSISVLSIKYQTSFWDARYGLTSAKNATVNNVIKELTFGEEDLSNESSYDLRNEDTEIEEECDDLLDDEDDDEEESEAEEAAIIEPPEQIVHVVDPTLLQNARVKLSDQRRYNYESERLDAALSSVKEGIELLEASSEIWTSLESASANDSENAIYYGDQLAGVGDMMKEKQDLLAQWEDALNDAEEAVSQLLQGKIHPDEANDALSILSEVSIVPVTATAMDVSMIRVPGEGCEGRDYIRTETEEWDEKAEEDVVVVGGIDVDALDYASDAPVRKEDAQATYASLMKLSQSTGEALAGPKGLSSHARQWADQIIKEECEKEDIYKELNFEEPIINITFNKASSGGYTARDALVDIDRLMEIERADRTGEFDYASVVNGARVLRRGPYSTSPSLYETLPLLNRILAYTRLRFYGHPPEVALRPTTPMYSKGQCWSFQEEWANPWARKNQRAFNYGVRGEYATLTVNLVTAVTVTEVLIEHIPSTLSTSKTAIKDFRIVGYEDGGAFGVPWELGTFRYEWNNRNSMQRFKIETDLGGPAIPKLKAIALAIDSNWGADYSCLYRFRVHGF